MEAERGYRPVPVVDLTVTASTETTPELFYETLNPLGEESHHEDLPSSYTVFKNQIVAESLESCVENSTPELDYFSLSDVVEPEPIYLELKDPPSIQPASYADLSLKRPSSKKGVSRAGGRIRSPMLQLHKEIVDFCEFISPTPEEQESRSAAINYVSEVIRYIWPLSKVEVFGSFKTGLYLPTSDVDVVILESNVRTPQIGLQALAKALSKKKIAKKIQVIAKARVPIIKFVEKQSGISFDISFDVINGPEAANFMMDAVAKIPPLRPLCMILKIFLQQRELNEVYSGGIGSYALLAMLIAYLQMQWKGQNNYGKRTVLEHNLGVLLVNFFDFYGRKLNIWDVGISCGSGGNFFLKRNKGFLQEERPHFISIEDPQAPDNDIGKNSYNYFQVRSAFAMAHSLLTDGNTIMALSPKRSILGIIIRPDPALVKRKAQSDWIRSWLSGEEETATRAGPSYGEMLGNWQLDDDDPLPRGNPTQDIVGDDVSFPASKKRSSRAEVKGCETKKRREELKEGCGKEARARRRKSDRHVEASTAA
ncbi:hypothetical protein AMTRI_Chr01g135620 [Amborella trichopoda]|uniref:polynucleotide adenylyltransferase n=1 Tax=Amborella trichopoda TaxID=13333 RepID=W1PFS3_AMBTC|nr:non-canonical poly(A) RNA polymerase PAPD5 isoform X2 [Amborella trichopoda]ERN06559.1 hypothetical protein AMTR_s00058p00123890 [Amborella trichopoda]|eukprot:XP_006844884.1 non-canonical poly(A) RNA polymerase PAPD5 isoform X2 [Amborella trichopoda]